MNGYELRHGGEVIKTGEGRRALISLAYEFPGSEVWETWRDGTAFCVFREGE